MIYNSFINTYFVIHNIEILGINWKLWYYKNDKQDTLYDFLDMHISAGPPGSPAIALYHFSPLHN